MERTHLGVIAGAPGVPTDAIKATRALMDYIYLAQYPSHDDTSLKALRSAIKLFHESKQIWVSKNARRSKEGNIITHMDIPKAHTPHHLPECIELKGSADGYTAETPEHLHIEDLKSAYPFTNHREYQTQMIRWLVRRDSVYNFDAFQSYLNELWPSEEDDALELEHGAEADEVVVRERRKRKRAPRMENNCIMLNKNPDRIGMEISAVQELFRLPNLQRDLLQYLNATVTLSSGRDSQPHRPTFTALPSEYHRLQVWFSVRVQAPRPNVYYKEEWWRVRAQPQAIETGYDRFDPVLLVDKPGGSSDGIHGM